MKKWGTSADARTTMGQQCRERRPYCEPMGSGLDDGGLAPGNGSSAHREGGEGGGSPQCTESVAKLYIQTEGGYRGGVHWAAYRVFCIQNIFNPHM